MNVLPRRQQVSIVHHLVEGNSVRSTERLTGHYKQAILALLVRVGAGCARLHDWLMRDLHLKRVECDEIWGFVAMKQKQVDAWCDDVTRVGDAWTFVAFDPETKLVPAYRVGKRDGETTDAFIDDLKSRLVDRVQITTDGLALYVPAIEEAFGPGGVDYARLIKSYESGDSAGSGRYSPADISGIDKHPVFGSPEERLISTSGVERKNLTIRTQMRRMTRLTIAFSKKWENHTFATHLHFAFYNLCRVHGSIRVTPAMQAGVTDHVWSVDELLSAALDGARP